jgi:ribonucleoside-diphosphate reductase alpha chain
MFNREASKKKVESLGRRDPNHAWGTNPCSEIILRPNQFCNLTSVIVRAEDTEETLKRKVELCTILGTFQSTLTKFPYLRKVWIKNTEEERLLGVSLCGVLDNKMMSTNDEHLKGVLQRLREASVVTNKKLAEEIGIQQSAAINCIKPEGTVSQLVDAASGMHHRHSKYYIRRVRGDIKDPLSQFMISAGVPNEPCVMRPDSTVVFSFPMKAPEGAATRETATAMNHLELWLTYQRHYCEHKPSITVSVLENEWPEVGAWVWNHFDEISGVSFLPMDGGTYRQAPYEEITQEQYETMYEASVKQIDWSAMREEEDNVEGAQMLACVAGVCEI